LQSNEHNSSLGRWQVEQRSADPRLRAYVHGYFASSSLLANPVRERHLPSLEVPLLLNFGAPHRRRDQAAHWSNLDGAWFVGLHDGHQLTEAAGERHFMVVRFTPIGAHLFLRLPMERLANQAIDLREINSALASHVIDRVGSANSWSARFAAMEQLIAERVLAETAPDAMTWAWRKLETADGRVSLGGLAAELECSHRHLIAQFRTVTGLPPKTVARLLRFNGVLRVLNDLNGRDAPAGKPYIEAPDNRQLARSPIPWAGIAADCGYTDQAHFIREFRHFAGSTPARFQREVLDA
jgi:AraC-like DNA-binding protein